MRDADERVMHPHQREALGPSGTGEPPAEDRGLTLVEILVSIMLMSTVVLAVVGALRVTITASALERDHARAHQWLQSAAGVLQAAPRVSCQDVDSTPGEVVMRETYEAILRDPKEVESPAEWQEWQISIVSPVRVWDGSRYWDPYSPDPVTGLTCYEPLYQLQLMTIQVVSPDQRIIESREVVKSGD